MVDARARAVLSAADAPSLGRSAPGLLPTLHPGAGTGPLLHGWEQAEPPQAPLFQPHALASEMPSKEPFVPLPVAFPRPLQPFSGHWGSSPPGFHHKPPARGPAIPTHRGASAHGAAGSAHRTSRASSYLFRERKKKNLQHLAALLLFFFSVATQNFSRQRRAPAPAVPTGGAGPRTAHPGVVGVGEG